MGNFWVIMNWAAEVAHLMRTGDDLKIKRKRRKNGGKKMAGKFFELHFLFVTIEKDFGNEEGVVMGQR